MKDLFGGLFCRVCVSIKNEVQCATLRLMKYSKEYKKNIKIANRMGLVTLTLMVLFIGFIRIPDIYRGTDEVGIVQYRCQQAGRQQVIAIIYKGESKDISLGDCKLIKNYTEGEKVKIVVGDGNIYIGSKVENYIRESAFIVLMLLVFTLIIRPSIYIIYKYVKK